MGLGRATSLAELTAAPLTYPEVGATRDAELPIGYHHVGRRDVVGHGRTAFERASTAVVEWRAQRGAGLRVRASGPATTVGTVVLMTAGLPRLGLDIPCRVVWVVQDDDRRGFGYGTLPGHPERGEESFVVTLEGDDVVFTMRAFSLPATRLARLGGPVTTLAQSVALGRYTAAVRRAAGGG